jgi:periplasmic copper chaperone A
MSNRKSGTDHVFRVVVCALLLHAGYAWPHSHEKGDILVRHPWSRATPPGAKVGVAYMEIRNRGAQPDKLLAASTPIARAVEMHVTQREGEVMKMRQVQAFEIPARERYALRPGGSHLMLVELTQPLKQGERFTLRLRFERAGELEIELEVQEIGSRHPRH